MDFPDVPPDAFYLCVVKTKAVYEVGYAICPAPTVDIDRAAISKPWKVR